MAAARCYNLANIPDNHHPTTTTSGRNMPQPQLFAFNTDEIADGTARQVPSAPHIAVYRVDGEFYATQDSCTHEQWSLGEDSELEGYEVVCPLHLARFDIRDGSALCIPAVIGLRTYPVTVVDGRVLIEVDEQDSTTGCDPRPTATGSSQ
jgi:nitrite reductase/ring-hydroxylating ferredoxin subunit